MVEDGGGKSLRHPEEGGRTAGGNDMKGSSGPGEWTSPQKQQHGCVSVMRPLEFSAPEFNCKFKKTKEAKTNLLKRFALCLE